MSEIDDLDETPTGITTGSGIAKQHLRRGLRAAMTRREQRRRDADARAKFLRPDRKSIPSLPRVGCLERPITNYLEE